MRIQSYLINLERSPDRLEAMVSRLRSIGLEFQRVPAFDGRGLDLEILRTLPDVDNDACLKFMGRSLLGTEYGCYKSHLDCARRIVESGAPQALVFEDDVEVHPNLPDSVQDILFLLSENNFDWDLVNLGAFTHPRYTTDVGNIDECRRTLAHAHSFPWAANALLWNRQGALRFISEYSTVKMPVDDQFREYLTRSNRGFMVWPPLTRHLDECSTIDPSGTWRERNPTHVWNYGFLKRRRNIIHKLIAKRHRRRAWKRKYVTIPDNS